MLTAFNLIHIYILVQTVVTKVVDVNKKLNNYRVSFSYPFLPYDKDNLTL